MEVFGHVTNAFSKGHEGTGLGLPLTQKLVQAHDGTMEIASALGVGTTVTVTFPRKRAVQRQSLATQRTGTAASPEAQRSEAQRQEPQRSEPAD